jgi:hypothetical protein
VQRSGAGSGGWNRDRRRGAERGAGLMGPGELGLEFWPGNRVLGFQRKWELGKESRTKVEVVGRKRMVGSCVCLLSVSVYVCVFNRI